MKGYKFCLHKAYLDKGMALTNYVKYIIVILGVGEAVSSNSVNKTLFFAFLYAIGCYFIGWKWFNSTYVEAEMEVGNQFNPFVKEVRERKHI